nr:cytochrome P450 [Flexivirga meconopsidis]
MFVALLQHPEALDALRADPGLLPSAVEELLRYDSAFELTTWRFLPSTSDLHGRTVTGGDSIIVSLCAANRDEREFDRADELVLDRNPNPHLAFGHGKHYCPGAALARIEFQVALEVLLCRLESLSLACDPAELEWTPAVLARGVDRLPVLFERRA